MGVLLSVVWKLLPAGPAAGRRYVSVKSTSAKLYGGQGPL